MTADTKEEHPLPKPNWLLFEVNFRRHYLEETLNRTKGSFERRMRKTVWDVISFKFRPEAEPAEEARSRKESEQLYTNLDVIGQNLWFGAR